MNAPFAPSNADFRAAEMELCRRSLRAFAKQAWPILEPAIKLKWGWALDAVCDHLEAVTKGDVVRLLINIPPGMMKSLLVGVIWPSWEWGPRDKPHLRYLGTAHKESLAIRDAIRMRRVINSSWYQDLWPIEWTQDQNNKTKFENMSTGFREAMAFTSMTGSRGDRIILDDPLSVADARSDVELENAALTFTEALPTRRNNEDSATVVIMQRLDERDTSGVILSNDLDYVHLCLPMEFEPDRKCYTSIGFEDPRTEPDELLMPDRYSREEVDRLKKTLMSEGGSYAVSGQLQQRPAPRGGGLIKREWLKNNILPDCPKLVRAVRGWDLAATAKDESRAAKRAAFTAGGLVGIDEDDRIIIADVRRTQKSPGGVKMYILNTAAEDGLDVRGSIPQDPGQAGKSQVNDFGKSLMAYDYHFSPETGSKYSRALPFAAQAEMGNVYMVEGDWNDTFLNEVEQFPRGTYKDQVDAVTRAYGELVSPVARAQMFLSKRKGR